jgi:hypothetical protein
MGALSYTLAGTDAAQALAQVARPTRQRRAAAAAAGPVPGRRLKAPALGDTRKLELVSGD